MTLIVTTGSCCFMGLNWFYYLKKKPLLIRERLCIDYNKQGSIPQALLLMTIMLSTLTTMLLFDFIILFISYECINNNSTTKEIN